MSLDIHLPSRIKASKVSPSSKTYPFSKGSRNCRPLMLKSPGSVVVANIVPFDSGASVGNCCEMVGPDETLVDVAETGEATVELEEKAVLGWPVVVKDDESRDTGVSD